MPKLKGIEEKYLFGKPIDKENDDTFFVDSEHIYLNKQDGSPYISCTQLIHEYSNPFNVDFFAKYKALEQLADSDSFSWIKQGLLGTQVWKPDLLEKLKIDEGEFNKVVEEIKTTWEKNRIESAENGTKLHELLENSFYGKSSFDLSKYGCPQVCGNYSCIKGNYRLDLENGIYPELLISYVSPEGLHIAGTADLVVKSGNNIDILDWKSSKEIKKKSYFNSIKKKNLMMKYPLTNIMDSNYYHYSLQLSLYAYMLQQKNPEFNIRSLTIVQIPKDGDPKEYPANYLKDEVERVIKHYAKQQKIKCELERDKPFIM